MSESAPSNGTLDVLSDILLRCFVGGVVFLLFWFCMHQIICDAAYGVHARLFDLSKHEFELMNYYGMAYVKISVIMFFLLPYIAVRLTLRKRKD